LSQLEDSLLWQIKVAGLPIPEREFRFDKIGGRRWRFDLCWVAERVAVECEGGTWTGGRHTRGAGFERDCEKQNAATLAGWKLYRFTAGMIERGEALNLIEAALENATRTAAKAKLGGRAVG
jgi:very-short-patch-repair endonuclease